MFIWQQAKRVVRKVAPAKAKFGTVQRRGFYRYNRDPSNPSDLLNAEFNGRPARKIEVLVTQNGQIQQMFVKDIEGLERILDIAYNARRHSCSSEGKEASYSASLSTLDTHYVCMWTATATWRRSATGTREYADEVYEYQNTSRRDTLTLFPQSALNSSSNHLASRARHS